MAAAEMRKKISLYLHPEEPSDLRALNSIGNVSQKKRGELYRQALITGLALHELDERIPSLVTSLHSKPFTVDDFIRILSTVTGWKPQEADIQEVLNQLNALPAVTESAERQDNVTSPDSALAKARSRLKSLI